MSWKNVQYKDGKLKTSEGGSGGSSTFAGLDDVNFTNLADGQIPKYDSQSEKWVNDGIDFPLKRIWVGTIPKNSYVDVDVSATSPEGGTFIFTPRSTNHFGVIVVSLSEYAGTVSYSALGGGYNLSAYSFSRPSSKVIRISMNNNYDREGRLYQFL